MDKKMLAIPDGNESDGNGRYTSFAMLPSDRKVVMETRSFSNKCESKIAVEKSKFDDKSWLGLWWDAKGIFAFSNKSDVTEHMERYRKFYEDIVTFTDMVENGDKRSYENLLDIYIKLERIERDAERDVQNKKSKAICKMLKEFLSTRYSVNHNLKTVECIVLRQKVEEVEETCRNSTDAVKKMTVEMNNLFMENKEIKRVMMESNAIADKLYDENLTFKSLVENLKEEKKELVQNLEEVISLEAEKRFETFREESERRLKEMMEEENSKAVMKIMEVSNALAHELHEETQKVQSLVVSLKAEKDELKSTVENKMKELSSEANERWKTFRVESDRKLKEMMEETNSKGDARCQDMFDKNQSAMQMILEKLETMDKK